MFQQTFRNFFRRGGEREGTVATPWGKTWFCRFGDSGGAPLIVIHGGPGFPHNYLLTLKELAVHRPVIFYDQHGCGRSPHTRGETEWTVEEFVEELRSVMKRTAPGGAHLLGHSWGAVPALECTLGGAGTRSLVFASPFLSNDRWMADAARLRRRMPETAQRALDEGDRLRVIHTPEYLGASELYYERHVYGVHLFKDLSAAAAQSAGRECYLSMWGPNEFTINGSLSEYEGGEKLSLLQVPVLYTCGRSDEATPESIEWFASLTPGSQSRVFELSAHNPHLSEPSDYVACLESFFQSVERG